MMFETLKTAKKVIGVKQTTKAVEKGLACVVYVAQDADSRVTQPLKELCSRKGVKLEWASSKVELGKACAIEVSAAAVAVLK
ncbi:MAG: L7Ae/L30e/S12e/Gadd45 family ribosomal protein [Negativicutes bacterium]|jgi:large subunit ribosomal protein L7A